MLTLFAVALIAQAARVQLFQGKDWAERARRQQFRTAPMSAPRGKIFDAAGNVLVESRELLRINVAPREVKDPALLSRALRDAGFEQQWASAAIDQKRKWVTLPGLHVASEMAMLVGMKGVHPEPVVQREYVGTNGLRRIAGDLDRNGKPISGIELALDSVLSGDSARAAVARDVRGRRIDSPEEWAKPPRRGNNVTLTINTDLQEICERALARATDSLDATGGDIVVMNPNTGEILAMANRRRGEKSLSNTAVTEPFEPGSTLKPFIAAALLERKRARTDEVVDTHGGELVIYGRKITDLHRAKSLSLADVIRYSSNIGIVTFGSRLSRREQYETFRDIGLGTPTGIPLPGESEGILRRPAKWSSQSAASMVMGYEISVTPLQLVAAYASLANGGELLQPHLISEIRSADGDLIYKAKRRVLRRVFSESVANEVRDLLKSVVDSGTAVKADLATFQMAGKSGTARRTEQGKGYVEGNYTASFVGLFPANRPQYVVLVKLDSPRRAYFGGEIAAPVSAVVLRAALAARNAALDRGDLASVERDVPLPESTDNVGSSRASLKRAPRDTVTEVLSPAEVVFANETSPGDAERTPRPATVVPLPFKRKPSQRAQALRPVPDVRGLSTRAAVRALHEAGFRVALVTAQSTPTVPIAGTLLIPGSIIKLQHTP
jgi:cell division protein FtsI (penicillin-binding protein 3)